MMAFSPSEVAMRIPVPAVIAPDGLPRELFCAGPVVPALVPACCIDMQLLTGFRDRMAACGESVQVQRMRYDRRYAFACIALAHGSADALLRQLAVTLFDLYLGGPGPGR
jgi:hypothetical protein